jgi:hypothetical protein
VGCHSRGAVREGEIRVTGNCVVSLPSTGEPLLDPDACMGPDSRILLEENVSLIHKDAAVDVTLFLAYFL